MKKKRIRFDRIFIFLFIFGLAIYILVYFFDVSISNIYITNNNYLTDQQIIELANLENYPSTFSNLSFQIKNKLEKSTYIDTVKVKKKGLREVYIDVIENRPLFYYKDTNKTVLLNGKSVDTVFAVPTVLNYITDKYYDPFLNKMKTLNTQVLNRISEIEFVPNEVDDTRFLFYMIDGNFVYVNIDTFDKVNKYISIMESLPNKKGVLYLDYGNNFDIIE